MGALGSVGLVGLVNTDLTDLTDPFLAPRPWSPGHVCLYLGIPADIPSPGNLFLAYNIILFFLGVVLNIFIFYFSKLYPVVIRFSNAVF